MEIKPKFGRSLRSRHDPRGSSFIKLPPSPPLVPYFPQNDLSPFPPQLPIELRSFLANYLKKPGYVSLPGNRLLNKQLLLFTPPRPPIATTVSYPEQSKKTTLQIFLSKSREYFLAERAHFLPPPSPCRRGKKKVVLDVYTQLFSGQ